MKSLQMLNEILNILSEFGIDDIEIIDDIDEDLKEKTVIRYLIDLNKNTIELFENYNLIYENFVDKFIIKSIHELNIVKRVVDELNMGKFSYILNYIDNDLYINDDELFPLITNISGIKCIKYTGVLENIDPVFISDLNLLKPCKIPKIVEMNKIDINILLEKMETDYSNIEFGLYFSNKSFYEYKNILFSYSNILFVIDYNDLFQYDWIYYNPNNPIGKKIDDIYRHRNKIMAAAAVLGKLDSVNKITVKSSTSRI